MLKTYESTATFATKMDAQDPLHTYRERFHLPIKKDGTPHIYLCGNSLGLQPKSTRQYIEQELLDWEKFGVEGHFHARHPWMPYHEFLTKAMANVVGAKPEEVVVMNTLSVNLHLMMVSFYLSRLTDMPWSRKFVFTGMIRVRLCWKFDQEKEKNWYVWKTSKN